LQPCPLALVDGEAGAGDLDAQLEVDDVVFAGQLPVRQCVGGQFGDGAARLLATIVVGTPGKYIPVMVLISIINALLALLVMQIIV